MTDVKASGENGLIKTASIAGYLLMVIAILGLLRAGALLARAVAGQAAQLAAVALMVWARATFGRRSFHAAANPTDGGLVTRGPYGWMRHPIYSAVLLFTWAAVLTHASTLTFAMGVLSSIGVAIRIAGEERLLVGRYPEYRAYAARTRRIVPGLF